MVFIMFAQKCEMLVFRCVLDYVSLRRYLLEVPSSLTSCTIRRTLCVNFPTRLVPAATHRISSISGNVSFVRGIVSAA